MADEMLSILMNATLAITAGIVLTILLRLPLRRLFGVRAAYMVWLLVPLSLAAVFLPSLDNPLPNLPVPHGVDPLDLSLLAGATLSVAAPAIQLPTVLLAIWFAGAALMLTLLVLRQRRLRQLLGMFIHAADGTLRSSGLAAPLVIGAWRPRIVLPADYEERYDAQQRRFMSRHEQIHLSRQDTRIGAVGGLLVCVFWFNPLLYWALRLLRLDQELACDATTVASTGGLHRAYAEALLSTQVAQQNGLPLPASCHWQSIHPLKTRIAMLKRPLPGPARFASGIFTSLALVLAGSLTVWAAQPASSAAEGPVVVSMKWLVENGSHSMRMVEINRLVQKDDTLTSVSMDGRYSVACKAHRLPAALKQGDAQLDCTISQDGTVVHAVPAMTMSDGELPSFDTRDRETGVRIYVVLNASTSAERIQRAQQTSKATLSR